MPGDFSEYFDLRKLDERKIAEIQFVLSSYAYRDSFKPYMLGILRALEQMWRDRSQKRKEEYSDDFIGGGVAFGEGLMKFFELLLSETDLERMHKAMGDVSNEMLYDIKRHRGEVKPVVGLDQPTLPQPAADEDY